MFLYFSFIYFLCFWSKKYPAEKDNTAVEAPQEPSKETAVANDVKEGNETFRRKLMGWLLMIRRKVEIIVLICRHQAKEVRNLLTCLSIFETSVALSV